MACFYDHCLKLQIKSEHQVLVDKTLSLKLPCAYGETMVVCSDGTFLNAK